MRIRVKEGVRLGREHRVRDQSGNDLGGNATPQHGPLPKGGSDLDAAFQAHRRDRVGGQLGNGLGSMRIGPPVHSSDLGQSGLFAPQVDLALEQQAHLVQSFHDLARAHAVLDALGSQVLRQVLNQ